MKEKNDLDKKLSKSLEEMKALVEEGQAALEAKFSPAELRVARNSSHYKKLKEAVDSTLMGLDLLMAEWDNIALLDEYLDSGDWQKDFEADERGKISKKIPRDVLSEDALYNTLEDLYDAFAQMKTIVEHVDFPEGEETQAN